MDWTFIVKNVGEWALLFEAVCVIYKSEEHITMRINDNDNFIDKHIICYCLKTKVLPEPHGPTGTADLHFSSCQTDTSLCSETRDMG